MNKEKFTLEQLIKNTNTLPEEALLNSKEIEVLDKLGFILLSDNNAVFAITNSQDRIICLIYKDNGIYFGELCIEDKNSICNAIEYNPIAICRYQILEQVAKTLIETSINFLKSKEESKVKEEISELTIEDVDIEADEEENSKGTIDYNNLTKINPRLIDTLIPLSIPCGDSIVMPILETLNDGSEENIGIMNIVVKHMYKMREEMLEYLINNQ